MRLPRPLLRLNELLLRLLLRINVFLHYHSVLLRGRQRLLLIMLLWSFWLRHFPLVSLRYPSFHFPHYPHLLLHKAQKTIVDANDGARRRCRSSCFYHVTATTSLRSVSCLPADSRLPTARLRLAARLPTARLHTARSGVHAARISTANGPRSRCMINTG